MSTMRELRIILRNFQFCSMQRSNFNGVLFGAFLSKLKEMICREFGA